MTTGSHLAGALFGFVVMWPFLIMRSCCPGVPLVEDDSDLNAWMVYQFWTVASRRYSMDYASREAETLARRTVWWAEFVEPFTQPFPLLDSQHSGR